MMLRPFRLRSHVIRPTELALVIVDHAFIKGMYVHYDIGLFLREVLLLETAPLNDEVDLLRT